MYWKLNTNISAGNLDQTSPDYNGIKITAWSIGLGARSLQVRFEYGVMDGNTTTWTWWTGITPRGRATVHSFKGSDFDDLMGTASSGTAVENAYDLIEKAVYERLYSSGIITANGEVKADGDLT